MSKRLPKKTAFQGRGQIKKLAYVAMSGGVDSSVAAALLKKRGFDVVGVFMKPWQPWPGLCMWQGDREDALRTATVLGIPLLTWDFSKEYKKEVGDYMIREYKAGRTPNPDVMCNKEIKFGLFLKKALKEGADYIATGHYIRIQKSKIKNQNYRLFQAKDKNKDQSYFLWTLTQDQLKYCLFPVGDYIKPEVRKLAKKFGLPNHDKKDSQGVCFIGPLDMKAFLKRYIKPKKGRIILHGYHASLHGAHVIGEHDGVYYYTIGQRHGLDIKNGQGPYYVVSKDLKKNIIYVGGKDNLAGKTMKISNLSWINGGVKFPLKVDVRIRYRSPSARAILLMRNSQYVINFNTSVKAITSGQSAVFYMGRELLGGGIIR